MDLYLTDNWGKNTSITIDLATYLRSEITYQGRNDLGEQPTLSSYVLQGVQARTWHMDRTSDDYRL